MLRSTQEWYVREETLREASTCIVKHHYGLDLSQVLGGGTMSSLDGQRFPVRDLPDELPAHISPAHSENVDFFGVITVDVEAEFAELDTGGWRPLRPVAADRALM